ncbi:MAG: hypothetical protein EOP50_17480 [Sphingobacteriales bacterium]|nr:MAG: hypothetical protein EOP50_17480 [Sphingobacteriales bacterium]
MALKFNWSPFVGTQQADSPLMPADDLDKEEIVPRVQAVVSRIVRDTKTARAIKALHSHTCQLCGMRLELSPGVFYSEAHHLKPLGRPHNGPDTKANLICVCPNCHVKLDFHSISINAGQLKEKIGHSISQVYIDHHNERC